MTIQFHCEHCGKLVEAPDSAGGKRGKCPYCGGSNFIPSSQVEEEFDLAPLDEEEERRREQELRNLMQMERSVLSETRVDESGEKLPQMDTEEVTPDDVQHLVVNYCLDMADGKLERAETHLAKMRRHATPSRQAVKDFLDGNLLEPALDAIPNKVLHGYLRNLYEQLS